MNVPELLDEVRRHVPADAPCGTRWSQACAIETPYGTHQVTASARIDAQGRRREQFGCDGLRVERAVLLRLTCPEVECPHAVQVRRQWAEFHRRADVPGHPPALAPRPLIDEVHITVAQLRATARPARFPCYTPCPHGAHPALTIQKSGFDLFDGSTCLGGGVTESRGVRRPRLPTVQAAEAYLLARHLEALAAVGRARDTARGRVDGE